VKFYNNGVFLAFVSVIVDETTHHATVAVMGSEITWFIVAKTPAASTAYFFHTLCILLSVCGGGQSGAGTGETAGASPPRRTSV